MSQPESVAAHRRAPYELGDQENTSLGLASSRLLALAGALVLQVGLLIAVGAYAMALAQAAVAGALVFASRSLRRVVTTQGDDLAHLMSGVRKLTWALALRTGIVGVVFVLAVAQAALLWLR